METNLAQVFESALAAASEATDLQALDEVRVRYLGRKGQLTRLLKSISGLPAEQRPAFGQAVNQAKRELEGAISKRQEGLSAATAGPAPLDVTLPGRRGFLGTSHPVSQTMTEIAEIFGRLGFEARTGPEAETDYYNFEALNFPPDHPARDMQDTFFLGPEVVLRTHTSPIQIRTMEQMEPPVRMICQGKCFRRDSDATHSPMFHQCEGLLVDEGVSLADLKGVLTFFVHQYFDENVPLRFRPSFFPFTEPSAEVDIGCVICRGSGCRVCSHTGWLEILGSGMVDPAVFGYVGYDSEKYTGFAWGMGVERIFMLRHGIDDLRIFFENDLRFLSRF